MYLRGKVSEGKQKCSQLRVTNESWSRSREKKPHQKFLGFLTENEVRRLKGRTLTPILSKRLFISWGLLPMGQRRGKLVVS